jgi:hypothetical protein
LLQYRVILGANASSRVLTLRNPGTTTCANTSKPFTVARRLFAECGSELSGLCRHAAEEAHLKA